MKYKMRDGAMRGAMMTDSRWALKFVF